MNTTKLAPILLVLVGAAASGVGYLSLDSIRVECVGETCAGYATPVDAAACDTLLANGGEPATYDGGVGAALVALREAGAIDSWHTSPRIVDGGVACDVTFWLSREQAAKLSEALAGSGVADKVQQPSTRPAGVPVLAGSNPDAPAEPFVIREAVVP